MGPPSLRRTKESAAPGATVGSVPSSDPSLGAGHRVHLVQAIGERVERVAVVSCGDHELGRRKQATESTTFTPWAARDRARSTPVRVSSTYTRGPAAVGG